MPFDHTWGKGDKDVEILSRLLEAVRGPVALAFSYQAEDAAALHLLLRCGGEARETPEVFILDTGKLFPETGAYHRELENFFSIAIHRYYPDPGEEKKLEQELGEWGMRESLEKRHRCCDIRKVRPLGKVLAGKNAWVTGLRAAQSVTRSDISVLEWDEKFGLVKINPLAAWSDGDLWAYIEKYRIPLNPLYAKGFKSIGCAPCTRAVKAGEDIRAGRWWWENPEHKECGLHLKDKI
jgi:phosphoadenosine phosphosulfate reductase